MLYNHVVQCSSFLFKALGSKSPINPQEMPVVRVNGDETKGRLQVGFGHEGPRAQGFKDANAIIHLNISKGVRVFGNEIIDASPFRV